MLKRYLCIVLCLVFLFGCTACAPAGGQPAFKGKTGSAPLREKLIAENEAYTLEWNEENYGIILTDRLTGERWGTSPAENDRIRLDDFGMPVKRHEMVNSVLSVYYHDKKNDTDNNNVYSYGGVVEKGHVRCARIENGVHVEYYFDVQEFMIPVDFILYDDYLSISINPGQIRESSNIVTSISVAPFLCSVGNDNNDSYLFVPSGSGALIDTKSDSMQGKTFSAPIYGEDLSMERLYSAESKTAVHMPVFGVKSSDAGMCAVIEGAEEAALIEAISGADAYGYSSVYPTFQVRGYTEHQSKVFSSVLRTYIIYSDKMISKTMQTRFYPMSQEKIGYPAMAGIYREYLQEKGFLNNTKNTVPLNINIIGGSLITKSFLGIPYKTVLPATTLEQAADIITELSSSTDEKFSVNLMGFGKSGIDIGKIAGGYTISKKLGGRKGLKKTVSACKDNDVELFMNFDLINYSESSNGFNTFFSAATNAGSQRATQYIYDKATNVHKKSGIYYLLSPRRFGTAADKLMNKISGWKLDGISLSSISSLSYSDYSERHESRYYAKTGFSESVSDAIKKCKQKGKVMAGNANIYAAVLADCIYDVPLSSSKNTAFSRDIPFYQMVLKGYVPMFTESVNLSVCPDELILKAVESGCGISFTTIDEWDNSLIDSDYPLFYGSVYRDIKSGIIDSMAKLSDYYKSIETAHITENIVSDKGLHVTIFDNGVSVYVNYGDNPVTVDGGTVGAKDYLVVGGA